MLPSKIVQQVFGDNWPKRRRLMYLVLIYIACHLSYIIFAGKDTVLYQQIAFALTGAGTTLTMSYIFGAVWDDHLKRTRIDTLTDSDRDAPIDPASFPANPCDTPVEEQHSHHHASHITGVN